MHQCLPWHGGRCTCMLQCRRSIHFQFVFALVRACVVFTQPLWLCKCPAAIGMQFRQRIVMLIVMCLYDVTTLCMVDPAAPPSRGQQSRSLAILYFMRNASCHSLHSRGLEHCTRGGLQWESCTLNRQMACCRMYESERPVSQKSGSCG